MISILTVNYGRPYSEHEESIRKYTDLEYEYLVRDNTRDNIGFAKANNELIRRSRGDFIVLLNPDVFVTRGWIQPLIKAARDKIGIVQPRIVNMDGSIQSTGHVWKRDRLGIPSAGDRALEPLDGDTIPSACFGAALIRSDVVKSTGLLDERFFLYFEDVDYCQRARSSGWVIKYCPESTVIHLGHGNTQSAAVGKLAIESYHKWLKKWYPVSYYVKLAAEQYVRFRRVIR